MKSIQLIIMGYSLFSVSCVPDVYLIDRQTVLEQQASGQWLELDKVLYEKALNKGPNSVKKTKNPIEDRVIYKMTHSDKVDDK